MPVGFYDRATDNLQIVMGNVKLSSFRWYISRVEVIVGNKGEEEWLTEQEQTSSKGSLIIIQCGAINLLSSDRIRECMIL